MGAPKGNKFWENRMDMTKDGRKLTIQETAILLDEYISRCVSDKLKSPDWVGKDAEKVSREHMISMSIYGACLHLGIAYTTWYDWKKDKKYSYVLTRAETIFRAYNIEGAGAGLLNQSIIARLEGLTDKRDLTTDGAAVSIRVNVQDKALEDKLNNE